MKYIVSKDSTSTEFLIREDAVAFAESIGLTELDVLSEEESVTPSSSADLAIQKIDEGYPVPGTPYRLALYKEDRDLFSSMLVLINELLSTGYITTATPQSLKSIDGTIFQLTAGQFKSAMIGYGIYYKQLWDQYNGE